MHCILRTEKLKTGGNIGGVAAHNLRTIDVPNSDPELTHRNIVTGATELVEAVNKRITECYPDKAPRKNAVRAVETLLTASPEFFENANPGQVEKWRIESIAWAEKFWGKENVAQSVLHLDEKTPHLHIVSVPIVGGKLNCRAILGGRAKLAAMQTSYAKAMAQFGLERGLEGSKSKHISPKQYSSSSAKNPVMPKPEKLNQLLEDGTVFSKSKTRERTVIPYTKKNIIALRTAFGNQSAAVAIAEESKRARDRIKKAQRIEQRESANRVRDIPLSKTAAALGLSQSRSDRAKWGDFHIDDEKGVFNNFKASEGGKGSIDLVIQAHGCEFKEALQWMKGHFGEFDTSQALAKTYQIKARKQVSSVLPVQFIPPKAASENLPLVYKYLCDERKISRKLVEQHVRNGTIYADIRKNVVFLGTNNAELVGTGKNKFKGLSVGSDKSQAGFIAMPEKQAVSGKYAYTGAVESAVDALSFAELNKSPAVSSAGAPTRGFFGKFMELALRLSNRAVAAFDNDEAGNKYSKLLDVSTTKNVARKSPPQSFKDWNENLVFKRSGSGSPSPEISLSREKGFRPR